MTGNTVHVTDATFERDAIRHLEIGLGVAVTHAPPDEIRADARPGARAAVLPGPGGAS